MGWKRKGKKRRAEKYKIASVAWYFIGWLLAKKYQARTRAYQKKRNKLEGTRHAKKEQAKGG